ncbi:serum opacification factor [Streptococcus halichoeri]|uniref:serum opacification factor n=1 Tax=Streptococcus halichoeri TaxID=254785 RepID=UPI001C8D2AC6|nr:serum opacification factor [Streptococcus halichoeri]
MTSTAVLGNENPGGGQQPQPPAESQQSLAEEPQPQSQPQAQPPQPQPRTQSPQPQPRTQSPQPQSASSAANSTTATSQPSAKAELQTQMVETYTIENKEASLTLTDGKDADGKDGNKKLISHRDDKERAIAEVSREVTDNKNGTLDVTLTVTPKQIDEGADVIVLLDTSQKMSEDNFKVAKENITKLVKNLTGPTAVANSNSKGLNHNNRNSVRLINFYRKVNKPVELKAETVESELQKIWKAAKDDWDWGVDLQGAIHKAREIFDREKQNGKRQHIVLFSQGEATLSYDIKDKSKMSSIKDKSIATTNPLFTWLPIFDSSNKEADIIDDVKYLVQVAEKLGMEEFKELENKLKVAEVGSSLAGLLVGGGSLTKYLTLNEYKSGDLSQDKFNYDKQVGEGYHHLSFSERKVKEVPMRPAIENQLKALVEKVNKKLMEGSSNSWFRSLLSTLSLDKSYQDFQVQAFMKAIDYIFYKREYIYYNHNLSAQAEAKMAEKEGVIFYSFDTTKLQANKDKTNKKQSSDSAKFEKYLKEMSKDKTFLATMEEKEKFKDILTELTIKDEFTDKVSLEDNSWKQAASDGKEKSVVGTVTSTTGGSGWLSSSSNASLTWTLTKEELQKAFDEETPLTLTYRVRVNKDKFKEAKEAADKKRQTRALSASTPEEPITEKIITNTLSYKINNKKGTDSKLGDVSLSYRQAVVPVPDVDGEVIIPEAPHTGNSDSIDVTEDTIHHLPGQSGSYSPDIQITIEEDTTSEEADTLVGGHVIDITEDTAYDSGTGQSGHYTPEVTIDMTEDTQPERMELLTGGQADVIEWSEDTQPGQSGHAPIEELTTIEDSHVPKPGGKGEDNSKEVKEEQPSKPGLQTIPQVSDKLADLPTGDFLPETNDSHYAFFSVGALAIISAAGLLSRKHKEEEKD